MRGTELPVISPRDIHRSGLCIGCGSCVAQADPSVGAKTDLDRYGQMRPLGPSEWTGKRSETLARTCPFSPTAPNEDHIAEDLFPDAPETHWAIGRHRGNYVGHVAEDGFRMQGSSGGMVSWVLTELLRRGLVDAVAHVTPVDPHGEDRFFKYRLSRSVDEIRAGAKSRYYPVEMSQVLREIRDTPGRYAIVGVPCFIKAVQLLRREDPVLRERIAFTLGIFCGHMKSARMVESFAWQMGSAADRAQSVEFRLKDPTRPASTYTAQFTLNDGSVIKRDWWNLVDGDWGSGFFQYSACNFCDDVVAETADISFGDAWVEPYSSDGRGTNVVVVRSPVMEEMIEHGIREGHLELKPVDGDFVHETQAAGFRQRREGLAYRLTWPNLGIRPRKRVIPGSDGLTLKRKLVYRSRAHISAWSHRFFWLARRTDRPEVFLCWARAAVTFYHALTYSRGKLGEWLERIGLR